MDISEFASRLDTEEFMDWVDRVDQFLEWKDMPEDRKVKFVRLKLKGHTLV